MRGHSAVREILSIGHNKFKIRRTMDRPDLKILVADIYIASIADIIEIDPKSDGISCIVLIGFYNRYSRDAKKYAKELGVALYDNKEFFGAVNCTDKAFLNYVRKEKDN